MYIPFGWWSGSPSWHKSLDIAVEASDAVVANRIGSTRGIRCEINQDDTKPAVPWNGEPTSERDSKPRLINHLQRYYVAPQQPCWTNSQDPANPNPTYSPKCVKRSKSPNQPISSTTCTRSPNLLKTKLKSPSAPLKERLCFNKKLNRVWMS